MTGAVAGRVILSARAAELATLTALLSSAREGTGGSLVLHGEAGMGKSALLDHALGQVTGVRVLRVDGAQFEMELPYAALHQLCGSVLPLRERLPAPQRAALESVFGLREEQEAPSVFLAALAALGLLVEASEAGPVVCVVEDAQWLDAASMQALGFVARRISAERIVLVFVLRDPDSVEQLAGLPRLEVRGLDDTAAGAVFAAQVGAPVDADVRDRIVAEARGNPLALLELPRAAGPAALAGGFGGLPDRPLTGVLEDSFAGRAAELPDGAQALLLLAAAEPAGDPALLARAADASGVPTDARPAVERAGLLAFSTKVRFRHPLVRSAVYGAASPADRRAAHAALAASTDAAAHPDRRAWHRALAAPGPDEAVAAELEQSADRARARGGLAAAAAFLRSAADLTPDQHRRARRLLAAAGAALQAGAPRDAVALLDRAGSFDPAEAPYAGLLRSQAAFQLRRDAEATGLLLDAAADQEPGLAREIYLQALSATMFLDAEPDRLPALASRIRETAPRRVPARPVDLLLDALVDQATLPGAEAVPSMQRALTAFRDDSSGEHRWIELASLVALDLLDDASLRLLSDRQVHLARSQGALADLPQALNMQAFARAALGDLELAAASLAEAHAVQAATGNAGMAAGEFLLAAWRGDAPAVEAVLGRVAEGGGAAEPGAALYARAVLGNGLGDYDAALGAALKARAQDRAGSYVPWHLGAELVEAAVHAGQSGAAQDVVGLAVARARASGTDWAVGTALQCQALLADDADAGALYDEAVERLRRSGLRMFHARSQLLYGQWLRRRGRRVEARKQLREAEQALSTMGVAGFAARAGRELLATGEHPRRRDVDLRDTLTAQELNIARRVASGATSKEIAAELFLSPRTIDAHLRNIFPKLDVTSRRQLRGLRL